MTFIKKKKKGITAETFVPKFVHEGQIKGCYTKDAWGLKKLSKVS